MSKRKRYLYDNPPTVLPVNSEGLPYYNLPDVNVTATKLPKAKASDSNIQRYADAVANGEIKLTQIPDTELRNRVRAKPIVDKIIEDRDKAALPILGATIGMPAAIIGGISAAPTTAAIMNNPIVDAGLTVHGAITAPKNIKEGIKEIKKDNIAKGLLDLGLTALDLYGVGKFYKHGKNAAKRLAEAFVRQGDNLHTMTPKDIKNFFYKKPVIDYVVRGGKHPELAYMTGNYSGNSIISNGVYSHEGDVVDAFFGKQRAKDEYVKELSINDLSPQMQNYINKNYRRKRNNIRVYDLGDVEDGAVYNGHDSYGLYKDIELPGQEDVKKLGIRPDVERKYVLDPGGYHHVKNIDDKHFNEDIWKFNYRDYINQHGSQMRNASPKTKKQEKLENRLKVLGLKFIDSMGTPVVHTWSTKDHPLYYRTSDGVLDYYKLGGSLNNRPSLKHGGIYIKPSHRGRFTALKERTGHSATWFKENGTPAQKKMATFALNAAKWKH